MKKIFYLLFTLFTISGFSQPNGSICNPHTEPCLIRPDNCGRQPGDIGYYTPGNINTQNNSLWFDGCDIWANGVKIGQRGNTGVTGATGAIGVSGPTGPTGPTGTGIGSLTGVSNSIVHMNGDGTAIQYNDPDFTYDSADGVFRFAPNVLPRVYFTCLNNPGTGEGNSDIISGRARNFNLYGNYFEFTGYDSALTTIRPMVGIGLGYGVQPNATLDINGTFYQTGGNFYWDGTGPTFYNNFGLVSTNGIDTEFQFQLSAGILNLSYNSNSHLRIMDGNEAEGKVLTSDASGNANWQSIETVATHSDTTGMTESVPNFLIYTNGASDATYRVGGYINITSHTPTRNTEFTIDFFDENNVEQVVTITPINDVIFNALNPLDIRVKANTNIIIEPLVTGGGSVVYDIGASLTKLY